MSRTGQIWQWSAAELAAAIRGRSVSSVEVIRAHLNRIAAVNQRVNAITVVLEKEALRAARRADERIATGGALGPLHGVPFTVKENMDLVGSATTHGVVALKDNRPERDAPVIAHLNQAGAIPIGRTNMPDFGLRWHTDNDLHGATRNPWDPTLTPGGSSGGEAVAIATGMSPLGVGNDMGGSLRQPAYCCGITAVRPSFGKLSRIATAICSEPPLLYEQLAMVNGPMARHVGDLRIALKVMSQADASDPWWTPTPQPRARTQAPIRVALTRDPLGAGVAPSVTEGLRVAAGLLEEAGYIVEEADPPMIAEIDRTIEEIANLEVGSYMPIIRPMMSDEASLFLDGVLSSGGVTQDLPTYRNAIARRHRIAQAWNLFFERYPLLLGPVSTFEPFVVGEDVAGVAAIRRIIRSLVLTEACNLMGLPSVAVPVGVIGGLPQGVQLIATRFDEDLCFDAAAVIESRQGLVVPIDPVESRAAV